MTGPGWFSQPFPPEGATAAEGIRNQLGRPELDLLTILVRESAQNSWDARIKDGSSPVVAYRIELQTIESPLSPIWRDMLLRDAPASDQLPLRESLKNSSIRILTVSDRGTSGLGGPTRADSAVTKDHDFVSFVRNIGEPRDTEFGGGTYGFGKGIFYLVGKSGTILLHTRCRVEDGYETRLIGCALWKSYVAQTPDGEKRYTGRHWWGDTSSDIIEPLIGAEAEMMAARLGMTPFGPEETGTTVVVVDPLLDGRTPAQAASLIADTITWHLWPKMLDTSNGIPAMRFSVSCEGVDYPVPDPHHTRPLDIFVAAYKRMQSTEGKTLECRNPKKSLGRLGLEKRIVSPFEPTAAARMVGIETMVHHVCLLRDPELVVTYHAGPKPPGEHMSYAGVFRADRALDQMYSNAEPPSHDAWNHQSLEYPENTYVRTTFRRIKESLEGLLDLAGNVRAGSTQIALGAASSKFSPLVGGVWGMGGSTDYGKPGDVRTIPRPGASAASSDDEETLGSGQGRERSSGSGGEHTPQGNSTSSQGTSPKVVRRRPRVEYVGDPYLDERSGITVIVQPFRLPVPGRQRVSVDLAVALTGTGGRETDPPLGADMPHLLCWEDVAGTSLATQSCVIEGGNNGTWRVVVRPAADTVTEIAITAQHVEAGT